jgi:uncharacterized surface protein with fasciclin (FAS1) repeats
MLRRPFLSAAGAFTLAALGACANLAAPAPATVTDVLARTPDLSTLSRLVGEAGLADTLRGPGPYTLFAPSNEAFAAVPADTLAKLATDKELLRSVLTYHVLPAKVAATEVQTGNAKTVQGANVALSRAGAFVTVEDAVVQTADLPATNGVVHVVDRVLIPPKR